MDSIEYIYTSTRVKLKELLKHNDLPSQTSLHPDRLPEAVRFLV